MSLAQVYNDCEAVYNVLMSISKTSGALNDGDALGGMGDEGGDVLPEPQLTNMNKIKELFSDENIWRESRAFICVSSRRMSRRRGDEGEMERKAY